MGVGGGGPQGPDLVGLAKGLGVGKENRRDREELQEEEATERGEEDDGEP